MSSYAWPKAVPDRVYVVVNEYRDQATGAIVEEPQGIFYNEKAAEYRAKEINRDHKGYSGRTAWVEEIAVSRNP